MRDMYIPTSYTYWVFTLIIITMEEIKELLMEIMKNEGCSPIYALYLLTKRLA